MEYRILALYRFVPLVSPSLSSCDDSTGCGGGGGSNGGCNDEASSPSSVVHQQQQNTGNHHPPELITLQTELTSTLKQYGVKGTLLLAPEGINGTICYPYPPPPTLDGAACNENGASISASATNNDKLENDDDDDGDDDPVASYLKSHPLFGGPELRTRLSVWKEEENGTQAFHRLKIKIKAEIVTLGLGRPLVNRKPVPLEEGYEGHMMSATTTIDGAQVVNSSITNMDQVIANEATSGTKNETRTNQNQQQKQHSSTSSSTVISTTSSTTPQKHSLRQTYNELSNPLTTRGQYLNPKQWDTICINNPDVLVIDTRNTYEIDIGTFQNAIDPKTENFSDFPQYLEKLSMEYDWNTKSCVHKDDGYGGGGGDINSVSVEENEATKLLNNNGIDKPTPSKKKKPPPKGIAMFCTGGIRCEKATSYAIQSNLFPSNLPIYHLEGGILAYLDDVAKRGGDDHFHDATKDVDGTSSSDGDGTNSSSGSDDKKKNEKNGQAESSSNKSSTFHGECFVFDKRVAVTAGLKPTSNYVQCHGCRGPMDRRLLSSTASNNGTTENNGNCSSENMEHMYNEEEVTRYNELSKGISHSLPPLTYDTQTQQYYLPGLTCPRCHVSTTRESLVRFVERERQVEICRKEGRTLFCEGK